MVNRVLGALIILISFTHFALAKDVRKDVYFEQKLNATVPNSSLVDENGSRVKLLDAVSARPTILVFAYYRCPNLCTLVLNGLATSIQKLHAELGQDYQVFTVSISPKEKPPLAQMKMRTYLARLSMTPGAYSGKSPWRFLTGESKEIQNLTNAAGFHYKYDPGSGEYSHPSGIIVLTPRGKISRYFFGIKFPPQELEKALQEAAKERTGSLAEQILLYCLHYDPKIGKYGMQILWGIRIVAVLGMLALGLLIARLLRQEGAGGESVS